MTSKILISKAVRKRLSKSYFVVLNPDHPALMYGPDILIGGEGNLTAVFVVNEKSDAEFLGARLSACRLALPVETRVAAICVNNVDHTNGRVLRHFDETMSGVNIEESLAKYSSSKARTLPDKKALSKIKFSHAAYFATNLQIALVRHSHELRLSSSKEVMKSLENKVAHEDGETPVKSGGKYLQVKNSEISFLSKGKTMLNQLRQHWHYGMKERFTLDSGLPYMSFDVQPSVLLTDEWPSMRYDPEKPIRSAAFSGWIVAQPTTPDEIEMLIERAQHHIRKRVYGWS